VRNFSCFPLSFTRCIILWPFSTLRNQICHYTNTLHMVCSSPMRTRSDALISTSQKMIASFETVEEIITGKRRFVFLKRSSKEKTLGNLLNCLSIQKRQKSPFENVVWQFFHVWSNITSITAIKSKICHCQSLPIIKQELSRYLGKSGNRSFISAKHSWK